jgi:nicotinamide-nucleotide amidase
MTIAEIITIGDEILIGQTVDTNSAWMGVELNKIGIDVNRITSIRDREEEIIKALDSALLNAEVVLVTGGLGPTSDDITKPALCKYFNTRMVFDADVFYEISNLLQSRGYPMNENNRHQADVPEACTVLMNKAGTAPGMLFKKDNRLVISMPGVPSEMIYLMTEHVIPLLTKSFTQGAIVHKNIMTFGVPEAVLAERLEKFEKELPPEIKLAYLPSLGIIKLRLTARGNSEDSLTALVNNMVEKLYQVIPDAIYGEDEVTLEYVIGNLLFDRKLTVSTAESCTGGKIATMITSVPGCSAWYKGSIVAYGNTIKSGVLGVDQEVIEKYGAVSEETAKQMALGIRDIYETSFSIATTGIAGPSGGTEAKPVGTVWIAVSTPESVFAEKFCFGKDRLINISRFSNTALNMLRKQIISM